MLPVYKNLLCVNSYLSKVNRLFSQTSNFVVSEEVRVALNENKPVVALESTIITHGMPYPQNIKCALDVEAAVRKQGAIPATIAIIKGRIRVGLEESELSQLGDVDRSKPIKTSRRDLAFVITHSLNGGTTVSGTLIVANKMRIPIFATGGIGGVHREGEKTFDISADLIELGKSQVAVVSSGVKSILDVPKTLEYLETQGVFVAAFGDDKQFPAFYSRRSGCLAPYSVKTAREAAKIIHCGGNLNLQSGMLFAVPVPEEFALDEKIINDAIEQALGEARRIGIEGKEITPFLLGKIAKITEGKSLHTNMALIKNNAETAASIAVELAELRRQGDRIRGERPVVIGGSNLDCAIKLQETEIKTDGRIHFGKSSVSGGGVGRNICEALSKLGCPPVFISVLGNDAHGNILKNFIPRDCREKIKVLEGHGTGHCTVVFDAKGECRFLAGDMEIHRQITPEMVHENEGAIKNAPLIIFDANLTVATISAILKLADHYNIPAFFEPTDVEISRKPFETEHWKAVKFISPNLNELREICSYLKISTRGKYDDKLSEVVDITSKLINYVDNIIVTLGADGLVIARRGDAIDPLLYQKGNGKLSVRHYPVKKIEGIVNVSGAGDSLTSGLIIAMLEGLSEEQCVSVGLAAAQTALFSQAPVAERIFERNHDSWKTKAAYVTLI